MLNGHRRVIVATAILTLAIGLAACKDDKKAAAPQPPNVTVAAPVSRDVTTYIPATGQAAAIQRVDLVARVSGYLTAIKYKDGEFVKKGTVLFVIEQDAYKISVEMSKAAIAQQQALLADADLTVGRQQQLVAKQASSQAMLDDATAKRDSYKAAVDQAKAQLQQSELNLSYTTVTAPFDGVVTQHQADLGALVGVGGPTTLATIVQSAPLYVNFSLDEHLVHRVQEAMRARDLPAGSAIGQPVQMARAGDAGWPYEAKIDYVAPEIDASTGTLAMRALAPNADGQILPGNYLRIRIPLPNKQASLLVPDRALGSNQGGRYVLLVNASNVVEERQVQIGQLTDDGMRVIASGLKPDDRVIVGQAMGAIPGVTVRPEPASDAKAAR